MPAPVATATTAQVTGVRSSAGTSIAGALAASRTHASSSTCSMRSVTRIFRGVPMSMAASIDAPMSSVWMWQFQMPSPPTTTIESPMPAHTSLKAGMSVVGRLEEVHDLVAQVGDVAVLAALGVARERLGEHRALDLGGLGHGATVGDVEQHVEQEQEAGAAGVDHAGLLEHREHLGVRSSASAPWARAASSTATRSPPSSARGDGRLRRLAHDGEDRALHRAHHRVVGRRGGLGQGGGPALGVEALGLGDHARDAPQDLRQDHAGVAPRAHERAVADRLAHRRQVVAGRRRARRPPRRA